MAEGPQRKTIEFNNVKMEADVRKRPDGAVEMTIISQEGRCRGPASIVTGKNPSSAAEQPNKPRSPSAPPPEPEMPIEEVAGHKRALEEIGRQAFEDFEHDLENARERAKKGGAPITDGVLRNLGDKEIWRLRQAGEDYVSKLRGLGDWRKTLLDAAAESFSWRFDYRILPKVVDDDPVGAIHRMR